MRGKIKNPCRHESVFAVMACAGFAAFSQSIADVPWCRIRSESEIVRYERHSVSLAVIYTRPSCLDVLLLRFIAAPKDENCAGKVLQAVGGGVWGSY